MLRVPTELTFSILDDLTLRLAEPGSRVVQVPSSSLDTKCGTGLDGPLIQFLAAWSRKHLDSELYLAGEESSKVIENLLKNPHGVAALYFAKKVRFLKGEAKESKPFLRQFLPRLQAMQSGAFRETVGQRGCHLASFAGAANEWLRPLYPLGDDSCLLPIERFSSLLRRMFVAFDPTLPEILGSQSLDDLAHIFYELFDNTHVHGRRSINGDLQVPSVRGVLTRRLDFRFAPVKDVGDIGMPFFKYASSMIKKQRPVVIDSARNVERFRENLVGINRPANPFSARGFPFLELTVYDTGVGISSHYGASRGDGGITDPLSMLREAFTFGKSSKQLRGSGNGLPSVLASLNRMSGFLILRTSGVSLYQDFSLGHSSEFNPQSLGAFNSNLAKNPVGTSFSLLVPLGLERK
jgi:hypothetical protein